MFIHPVAARIGAASRHPCHPHRLLAGPPCAARLRTLRRAVWRRPCL